MPLVLERAAALLLRHRPRTPLCEVLDEQKGPSLKDENRCIDGDTFSDLLPPSSAGRTSVQFRHLVSPPVLVGRLCHA
ncbi:MAG: hypothetical protein LBP90_05060 [Burkholderiales bacterium]|nr:hypothetical protein [Burkholderiales bacterium]